MIGTIINYILIGGLFLVTLTLNQDLKEKYQNNEIHLDNIYNELKLIRHDARRLVLEVLEEQFEVLDQDSDTDIIEIKVKKE